MNLEPVSKLTHLRPDLWRRGIALAVGLTGYTYVPKEPLVDGMIFACGYSTPTPGDRIRHRRHRKAWLEIEIEKRKKNGDDGMLDGYIGELERIGEQDSIDRGPSASSVYCPEGAGLYT